MFRYAILAVIALFMAADLVAMGSLRAPAMNAPSAWSSVRGESFDETQKDSDPSTASSPPLDPADTDAGETDISNAFAPPGEADASEPDNGTTLHQLEPPLRVRFRLIDGVRITGDLTGWSDAIIDGSFGRRRWIDLNFQDIWQIRRRLIEADDHAEWVALGRLLLEVALDQPEAGEWAERAFRMAIVRNEGEEVEIISEDIARARNEVEQIVLDRAAAQQAAEAAKLATEPPVAKRWKPVPWPALTDEQQAEAVVSMKNDARRILKRAGLEIEPVETKFFLFYSDLPRRESAKWASELDLMYARLADRFELAPGANIFWGKAVIFVFTERDRFRLVEAEAFGFLVPEWADGFCHPIGPKVFVSFYRQPRDELFAAVLVHEASHGFMHRYRTPRNLPTWANEGFADYLAAVLFRGSTVDLERRRKGLRFVRNGGNVNAVLDLSYHNDSWPGPNEIGYSIGYLLVELMIRDRPKKFGAWVDAVKDGKDWEQALVDEFGVDRATLVQRFIQYYRVND